ncbi:MAG TPA: glycosyl hydrolase 115 family protein, partial [Puia sp.]
MKRIALIFSCLLSGGLAYCQPHVSENRTAGSFPLVAGGTAATLCTDDGDYWLVNKSAALFQQDIERVTGIKPALVHRLPAAAKQIILIGSLDHSSLIRQLVEKNKIGTESIKGKWECFRIQTVEHPFPGIDRALVIAGSDRRGTAFGVFEISRQMGVSPWYWWADVPVKKKKECYVDKNGMVSGPPSVKYRGIFINDEAPAFSGWTREKFGGVNHGVYEKIFELLLRLKANYLWPAMWGNAFNDDDTLNPILASKYGIVMGTSHHEPMLRAQQEWKRYGKGQWNYDSNAAVLRDFWRKGIEKMDSHESIVTIGMRGDGDMPMTEGSNIALLERIVHDQRQIIQQVTGRDPSETPQSWALYKEVQDYYDKGMRVPDDVTLLLCDDNWGNIRKLPKRTDPPRAGGYGIYYHFDYVGDPRNYKWLNTNNIARVWEQMHLADAYGANRIWIVNVGDLKPMEYPISFFLDYAWNTKKWNAGNLDDYPLQWVQEQFGKRYAKDIAQLLKKYSGYNSRRKPELLSPDVYSLVHYREAETVLQDYYKLQADAEKIYEKLPAASRDAFFELVLYPIKSCANLNALYITTAKNRMYASQGGSETNMLADSVAKLFEKDSILSHEYNTLAGGKWDHMMDQTHIGYTYWQQPPVQTIPATRSIPVPEKASMGVSIDGSPSAWPGEQEKARLPAISRSNKSTYIELFNRGSLPYAYSIHTDAPWLLVSPAKGRVGYLQRIELRADWTKVPNGKAEAMLRVEGPDGQAVSVMVPVENLIPRSFTGFPETNGYVSIQADHYSKAVNEGAVHWELIPGIGKSGNGMHIDPVTAPAALAGKGPYLEYPVWLSDTGRILVNVSCSPTLGF